VLDIAAAAADDDDDDDDDDGGLLPVVPIPFESTNKGTYLSTCAYLVPATRATPRFV
jgi:hypothetical protein